MSTPTQPLPFYRKIEKGWKCKQSGDCCKKTREIVMTKEEAATLVHQAPPTIQLQFRPVPDTDRFVAMKAGPCPLFVFNTCLVYEHRPFNCRRFGCMRPDPSTEPFDPDGSNMDDRVRQSREALKLAKWMQRKAQPWADAHGWPKGEEGYEDVG